MKNKLKEMKGITLIALVITIIVLLILVGVSIATLTGENGILTKANDAKIAQVHAEVKEAMALQYNEYQIYLKAPKESAEQEKELVEVATTQEVVKVAEAKTTTTFKAFLLDREIIDSEGVVNVKKLVGRKLSLGNGTEGLDIYKLEEKDGKMLLNYYEEEGTVTEGVWSIEVGTTGGTSTPPSQGEQAVVGEIVTGSNKYYTKNGTAKIPVGFAIVPGCDDVSQGLVISDVANDTADIGNQFVWIPVTDGSKYVRNTSYAYTNISANAIDDTNYLPEGITDEKQAVLNAGGFYIGRYEAGNDALDVNSSGSGSQSQSQSGSASVAEGILVCKNNVAVYNWISQEDAKAKAKDFIKNNNVKSALISGIQWDVTMATINGKKDGNGNDYIVTAFSRDRHIGGVAVAATGQNIADKVYNIYDLEGNCYEYVAEKKTYVDDSGYVIRGSSYFDSDVASCRGCDNGIAYGYNSFRLALYVM